MKPYRLHNNSQPHETTHFHFWWRNSAVLPWLWRFSQVLSFCKQPFWNKPSQDNLLQEQFIDLVNDGNVRSLFSEKSYSDFWIDMAQIYSNISKMAMKVLIPFPTTYEYESAFSALLAIKPNARNRFDAVHDMRVALSKRNQT